METRSVYQWIFFLKFLSIPTPGILISTILLLGIWYYAIFTIDTTMLAKETCRMSRVYKPSNTKKYSVFVQNPLKIHLT